MGRARCKDETLRSRTGGWAVHRLNAHASVSIDLACLIIACMSTERRDMW